MTDLEKKAAEILAVVDKIENGTEAKPAGYWGVAPLAAGHELDAELKNLSPAELEEKLDRLSGEVK